MSTAQQFPGYPPPLPGETDEAYRQRCQYLHDQAALQSQKPAESQVVYVDRGPRRAVVKSRKKTSHTFHLVMTLLTGGLWAIFVWIPIQIINKWGPRDRSVVRYK
jgi:hypothetical protein